MKIWHKIMVPSLVAIVFLLALGGISAALMARQGMNMAAVVKNRGGSVGISNSVFQELGDAQAAAYRAYVGGAGIGKDRLKALSEERATRWTALEKRFHDYLELPQIEAEERALVQEAQPRVARFRQDVDRVFALAVDDPQGARVALEGADAEFQMITASFRQLMEMQGKLTADSQARSVADFRNMLLAIAAIALFAAAASLATGIAMARRVVAPMRTAISAADEIARGDLTREIEVKGRDETADLLRAQARMKAQLHQLVGEVVRSARAVSDSSEQLGQGHQDLSQRTEMQASTLEETASSMEELTSTVQQNAENARVASQLAVDASEVARKGGQAVGAVVSTMTGISDSSRRISEIIGVIDGIAFQTNILALNAAVEAARAGEQGRGFAVVASEVRSLAQRSASAAKEIKALIGESVEQVEAGARQVDVAGETMQEIVSSVKKVSDLIAEIAAASREQSSGIGQVNVAVTQMDQVVQQNAALVEEATAATESLQNQSQALMQLVSHFHLGNDAPQAAALQPIRVRPAPAPVAATAPAPAPVIAPAPTWAKLAQSTPKPRNDGAWKEF